MIFFKSKGLDKYVKYALGHGVGIEVHESPLISSKSKDLLHENTVFTLEPGLHIPKLGGIRIEDTFVMTKKGPKALTKVEK
ncbi:hypothetical protein DRN74_03765 [Candidatus Micrarchaeota archaeon]|nr:MAG: hypothetical protein DRN74_03765 [Candidatus Micrarchaeota archaeon]